MKKKENSYKITELVNTVDRRTGHRNEIEYEDPLTVHRNICIILLNNQCCMRAKNRLFSKTRKQYGGVVWYSIVY
jgi:hypothetical protein